jgi:hypothetical protein
MLGRTARVGLAVAAGRTQQPCEKGHGRRTQVRRPVFVTYPLCHLNLTVVVAMVAVRMVQVALYQIIDVVAVRNRLVATTRAMFVRLLMAAAGMVRCTARGIRPVHFQVVFLHTALTHVVQMAVVQVIDMGIVVDGRVAAIWAVLVVVLCVMGCHGSFRSFLGGWRRDRVQFSGMGQRIEQQIDNVPIRQCIINVVALAPPNDEPLAAEQPKPLRDRRKLLVDGRDYLGDTQFALLEQV